MGAIIAESHDIRRVERLTAPLRDMFSAVFFVAIGLLIDPALLRQYGVPVAIITVALVAGKIVACSFGCFVAGYDRATSLRVGLGLAQIGEFSFIIAALGMEMRVTSGFLYPIAVSVSALTSILTPFLIGNTDRLIAWHDRIAPRSLLNYQRDYTAWIEGWRATRAASPPRRLLRLMLLQMSINVVLMAGVFLAAAIVDRQDVPWLDRLPHWTGGSRTVLWLAAVLVSLPIGIATLRKLQAFSMLTSEMTVQRRASAKATMAMRALVANTTLFAGVVGLAILLLLLSSFLLPPFEVLLVLAGVVVVIAILLRTFFIRIYSRAQVSIREVLSRQPEQTEPVLRRRLPSLLENAQLVTVTIRPGTVAVGKQIRELELRTRTGATAVALRRGGETIVSPEPELEFRPDDEILLIGSASQLDQAKELLASEPATS